MSSTRDQLAQAIFTAENQHNPYAAGDWEALIAGSGDDTYAHTIADALLAQGWTTKPEPIGYIAADHNTNEVDWDGLIHPTPEAVIESLTGPYQRYEPHPNSPEHWSKHYRHLTVTHTPQNVIDAATQKVTQK